MATQAEVLDMLETLSGVYNTEPGNVKAYFWALEEYDSDVLEQVARDYVKSSKWFPKPSELRELAERRQWSKEHDEQSVIMFWRMTSLLGDIMAGRMPDDPTLPAVRAVDRFFGFEELVIEERS